MLVDGRERVGSITAKRVFGLQTVTILNFAIAWNSGFSVETICIRVRGAGAPLQINGGMPAGRPLRVSAAAVVAAVAVAPRNYTLRRDDIIL